MVDQVEESYGSKCKELGLELFDVCDVVYRYLVLVVLVR